MLEEVGIAGVSAGQLMRLDDRIESMAVVSATGVNPQGGREMLASM